MLHCIPFALNPFCDASSTDIRTFGREEHCNWGEGIAPECHMVFIQVATPFPSFVPPHRLSVHGRVPKDAVVFQTVFSLWETNVYGFVVVCWAKSISEISISEKHSISLATGLHTPFLSYPLKGVRVGRVPLLVPCVLGQPFRLAF